ncbi:hypothetical protein NG800_019120 [Epilithonimonas ginsengisoli]|uniref:Uncharacterized protein n=1 Tax=Epilithonimonas ginsengisoli TaxID=1245592 RepID=A0ABU4JMW5_9FLAO|nr:MULTISPECIES: hypothetical protein [Chryseobacterium group]MBV6881948.1 hypothetical protein [Epilithonimonas sp. FP105]MDW8551037.1 hypothetical protein [Epilithonimonas ginsengisoli]OAH66603.1 hypothetical protein AXA65_17435 [Chryseobacterium sp. FP211-J200]
MKIKLLSIAILCILFSCGKVEQKKDIRENVSNTKVLTNERNLEELKTEASRLRAGGSIKSVKLIDRKAIIDYVSNFTDYKEINPQSSLTESELKAYWQSGDAIEKALIDGSVRIMRKLDFIDEVNIILPFEEKMYKISVNKSELEKFIGIDFKSITGNWDKTFSNPYVYDKKGREIFFKKFGVVK